MTKDRFVMRVESDGEEHFQLGEGKMSFLTRREVRSQSQSARDMMSFWQGKWSRRHRPGCSLTQKRSACLLEITFAFFSSFNSVTVSFSIQVVSNLAAARRHRLFCLTFCFSSFLTPSFLRSR